MSTLMKNNRKEFDDLYEKYKKFIGLKEFKVLYEFCIYKDHKNVLLKTILDQMNMICKMVSIIGKRINKWSKKDALNVYYKIYKMPNTRKLKSLDKDKPLSDFFNDYIEVEYETIAISTANKRFGYLKSYFEWLVDYGYLKNNLLKNLTPITEKEKDCRKRKAYIESDLSNIFSDELFHDRSNARSYKYWAPIIAALTGMRQNEIAQLYKRNIIFEEGFWTISIRADGNGQRVKNKNAIRKIPIPKKLIDLGFIDFIESIDEGQIFKEFKYCKMNGYARYLSRWFSNKKKDWGYDSEYNFHSFRHYLANKLKQSGVKLCIASEITGHGYNSVAYERYAKEYSLKDKKKILDKNISKSIRKLKRIYPKRRRFFLGFPLLK